MLQELLLSPYLSIQPSLSAFSLSTVIAPDYFFGACNRSSRHYSQIVRVEKETKVTNIWSYLFWIILSTRHSIADYDWQQLSRAPGKERALPASANFSIFEWKCDRLLLGLLHAKQVLCCWPPALFQATAWKNQARQVARTQAVFRSSWWIDRSMAPQKQLQRSYSALN